MRQDIILNGDDTNLPDNEVAQLRLQVSSLASQLANTEGELNRYRGVKVRRRSRGKRPNRSKLKFWRSWMRQLSQFNL